MFLDRDGTITPEVGYVTDPDELRLLPKAAEAVKILRTAGFKIIIVTNQSAVARGMMDIQTLEKINERLKALLDAEGAGLDGLYYCPHHPTEGKGEFTRACDCRKPAAGLFLKAAEEHGIDLAKSFFIGDKLSDISMAPALGAKGILVETGYGKEEFESLTQMVSQNKKNLYKPVFLAKDVYSAAVWILQR